MLVAALPLLHLAAEAPLLHLAAEAEHNSTLQLSHTSTEEALRDVQRTVYELLDTAVRSKRPAIIGRGSCGAEDCLALAKLNRHTLIGSDPSGRGPLCGDIHGMSGIYPDNLQGRKQFVAIWSAAIKALDQGDAVLMMACQQGHAMLLKAWAPHVRVFSDSKLGWDNIGFVAVHAARSQQLCDVAWTRVFYERTVLVIHPFVNTLTCQLQRQSRVHSCPHILPLSTKFKLVPMAVALGLTPHGSFNETLHATFDQIDAAGEFDIAIIGAGAYSMPIAQYVKEAKLRVAVVLGGASQLLFGIKGSRWEKGATKHASARPSRMSAAEQQARLSALSIDPTVDCHRLKDLAVRRIACASLQPEQCELHRVGDEQCNLVSGKCLRGKICSWKAQNSSTAQMKDAGVAGESHWMYPLLADKPTTSGRVDSYGGVGAYWGDVKHTQAACDVDARPDLEVGAPDSA